jgi:hypothetical protein
LGDFPFAQPPQGRFRRGGAITGTGGRKLVADAMHRAQIGQRPALATEEIANLYDVLVERAAADVGVEAPDRVNQ